MIPDILDRSVVYLGGDYGDEHVAVASANKEELGAVWEGS